jgi:hypothetical protein
MVGGGKPLPEHLARQNVAFGPGISNEILFPMIASLEKLVFDLLLGRSPGVQEQAVTG